MLKAGRIVWAALLCLAAPAPAPAPALAQAAAPTEEAAATVLEREVRDIIAGLAEQRMEAGGWPSSVAAAFDALTRSADSLSAARAAGNFKAARRQYRACMRSASRITRWLVNHFEPANDALPSREQAGAVAAQLAGRIDLLVQMASQAKVKLNLTPAMSARARVDNALSSSSTDGELLAALRSLRDAIDDLESALPDFEP